MHSQNHPALSIAWTSLLGAAALIACGRGGSDQETAANGEDAPALTYVGRGACAGCHQREHELWAGSHHDLAIQVAIEETVLGDFDDASFTHFGTTSTFFKRDGKYSVRTDGPDGELRDYEITYTFGVYPLQQYLIAFPGGRYQALGVSWDARPRDEGGQRWFHLYPDEPVPHDDPLHWTGPNQNWNYMCAACHSTNLRENYNQESDGYETSWSEIDVSCEACHGPGSLHLEWAEGEGDGRPYEEAKGLRVQLAGSGDAIWSLDESTGTARRSSPRQSNAQIETCAPCHSRRSVVSDDYTHGDPLFDHYRPALLDEALYYADGQILEEVYVFASFIQSKMYRAGVTCSDCHEPHSLNVYASDNSLCARCHLPARFDAPSHHHHETGSSGAACVECHMPATDYMVVDPRRDHSMRVPRPDLSVELGVPNACNACHTDRSSEWAASAVRDWFGDEATGGPHFGRALQAGWTGSPGAPQALERLANDVSQPGIARASALSLLGGYMSPGAVQAVRRALGDEDPLVRMGALNALEGLEPLERLSLASPLLDDPVRSVRIEAGRVLAPVPREALSASQREALEGAIQEYIESQLAIAERPEAHMNLGLLFASRRQFAQAEMEYRKAMRLDSSFVAAHVNLSDLYRVQGRDEEGERVLREALEMAPRQASVHHALGLLLVRAQRLDEAMASLELAAQLEPENPRNAYVFGVALNSVGESRRALEVLDRAHQLHPSDRDLLLALVTISRDSGALESAIGYARRIVELAPDDPGARRLLQELRRR